MERRGEAERTILVNRRSNGEDDGTVGGHRWPGLLWTLKIGASESDILSARSHERRERLLQIAIAPWPALFTALHNLRLRADASCKIAQL